jgi:hypothetical protein
VAAVLKYADSVLKGYATAMSVILTGLLSMALFGTSLSTIYFMGIVNGTCFLWGMDALPWCVVWACALAFVLFKIVSPMHRHRVTTVVTAVLLYNGKDLDQFVCAAAPSM